MELIRVHDKKTRKQFLDVARIIYKDDPHWVCPLDAEIEGIFDPSWNSFYQHGETERWILKNDKGKLIGRVAAFINEKKAHTFDQPTGGMGFFECINDEKAAFLLFDTAREWLAERGMEAMDGPVNFGENDNHWGLLVEGFMQPCFGMPYHLPYYRKLFEDYGFQVYYKQFSYHLRWREDFPDRFWKVAEWVAKKPDYEFRHVEFNKIDSFIDDMARVYQEAWQFHENPTPLNKKDVKKYFLSVKDLLEEDLIWFAYFKGDPIAFFIMFPDFNQLIKPFKGKLNLINKIRLLIRKRMHVMTRTRILIMGIAPRFQGKGVDSAIFWHANEVMKRKTWYEEIDMSWVGDFNPKMKKLYENVGGTPKKTHHTYRYLFDRNKEFKRSKIIGED